MISLIKTVVLVLLSVGHSHSQTTNRSSSDTDPEWWLCPLKFGYGDNEKCFWQVNKQLSWVQAQRHCGKNGGHLATIDSTQTSFKLSSYLMRVGAGSSWVGARTPQGAWTWSAIGVVLQDQGCYSQQDTYIHSSNSLIQSDQHTVTSCITTCEAAGNFNFASITILPGLEGVAKCLCDVHFNFDGVSSGLNCGQPCPGDSSEQCGSATTARVFKITGSSFANWPKHDWPTTTRLHCVAMNARANYTWEPHACAEKHAFVCQYGICSRSEGKLLNSVCVSFHTNLLTYFQAEAYCLKRKGRLLVLTSQTEFDDVMSVLDGEHYVWIGLTNKLWQWSDEKRIQNEPYLKWAPNEPHEQLGADCVYISSNNSFDLANRNCDRNMQFICQLGEPTDGVIVSATTTTPIITDYTTTEGGWDSTTGSEDGTTPEVGYTSPCCPDSDQEVNSEARSGVQQADNTDHNKSWITDNKTSGTSEYFRDNSQSTDQDVNTPAMGSVQQEVRRKNNNSLVIGLSVGLGVLGLVVLVVVVLVVVFIRQHRKFVSKRSHMVGGSNSDTLGADPAAGTSATKHGTVNKAFAINVYQERNGAQTRVDLNGTEPAEGEFAMYFATTGKANMPTTVPVEGNHFEHLDPKESETATSHMQSTAPKDYPYSGCLDPENLGTGAGNMSLAAPEDVSYSTMKDGYSECMMPMNRATSTASMQSTASVEDPYYSTIHNKDPAENAYSECLDLEKIGTGTGIMQSAVSAQDPYADPGVKGTDQIQSEDDAKPGYLEPVRHHDRHLYSSIVKDDDVDITWISNAYIHTMAHGGSGVYEDPYYSSIC